MGIVDHTLLARNRPGEASEAHVKSQAHEGWKLIRTRYDDGGYSGGSMERPALQKLLDDVRARRIDVIVVYKVDRLTRSLADFAKLVELFDEHQVSFVSVTQAFNTTNSMGRLTLNVLLSFAQFEREVTGERIRDKIAASKSKASGWGAWFRSDIGSRTGCGRREPRAVRGDFLVELRGFEPPTSAVGARGNGSAASGSAGLTVEGAPLDPALDRKSAVEVGASVHRRSSPRPSSFQIQVKS